MENLIKEEVNQLKLAEIYYDVTKDTIGHIVCFNIKKSYVWHSIQPQHYMKN